MGRAANKPLCQRFNVQYYPTINLFLAAENTEVRWPKDDTISADALHACQPPRYRCHLGCILLEMTAISLRTGIVKQSQPAASVEKLTMANFEETVMGSDEIWVVNLSAGPRCGACEGMKATMRKVAEMLAGVARVGTLLCDAEGGKVRCQPPVDQRLLGPLRTAPPGLQATHSPVRKKGQRPAAHSALRGSGRGLR